NLHPNRTHLIGAPASRQNEIQNAMPSSTTVGNWTSPYTDPEMRLFPHYHARYTNDFWWCEALYSPFTRWSSGARPVECGFLHLKYCKADPYANFSRDFGSLIAPAIQPGPLVPGELASLAVAI